MKNAFSPISAALKQLKKGGMVVVVDGPERENQGDCIFVAEAVTPEKVNFLLQECRGLICVAVTREHALRLNLPLMIAPLQNTEITGVQFTVTIDAKNVKDFGISASDRAKTIRTLASRTSRPNDLVRPGHVFPLLSRDGGVLERPGHTEATIDLMKLAGFRGGGVLCEVLNRKGEVARLPELMAFSRRHNIPIVSIEDLLTEVRSRALPIKSVPIQTLIKTASSSLPTKYGKFRIIAYRSIFDDREHVALVLGKPRSGALVRIHSQCLTGDTLFSLRCDCGEQLKESIRRIGKEGSGVIIYASQEGRGIGLGNKIKAYALQDTGLDTAEANLKLGFSTDQRTYEAVADILKDQKICAVRLLTNNPEKIKQLESFGITVTERIALESIPNKTNARYLRTKKHKMGHYLTRV